MEVADQGLPSEIMAHLTDAQAERLRRIAEMEGISIDEMASRLLSEGVDARYRMPSSHGSVSPIKGLKQD
jgi:type III secretory pathway component EscU